MRADERNRRITRAVQDVLTKYSFVRTDVGDEARFLVTGGSSPYTLVVSKTWAHPPKCSCPDNSTHNTGGYCKHAMGAMLKELDLRGQLLEVYL